MITKVERERLHQFFAGYFHEDWAADSETPKQILSTFVRQQGPGPELKDLGRFIVAFVHEHPGDHDLDEALFKQLGCYYSPHADGIPTRTWLLDIAAYFAKLNEREEQP